MNPDIERRIAELYQSDEVKGIFVKRSDEFFNISRSIWVLKPNFMISNRIKITERVINKIKLKEESLPKKYKNIINSAKTTEKTLLNLLIGKNPIIEDFVGYRFVYTKPKDIEDAVETIEEALTVNGCKVLRNKTLEKDSGYKARHLIITLPDDVKAYIELQMTTLMRLAWSDLEHDVVYKSLKSLSPDQFKSFLEDNFRLLGKTTVLLEDLINLVEKHSSRK